MEKIAVGSIEIELENKRTLPEVQCFSFSCCSVSSLFVFPLCPCISVDSISVLESSLTEDVYPACSSLDFQDGEL